MGNGCCSTPRKKVTDDDMENSDAGVVTEENVVRILFKCGEHCGFGCASWESGIVHHVVPKSQAEELGINPGWKIHSLDNEKYSFGTLMEKMKGRKAYEIAFFETNHFVKEETLKFNDKSLGVKCENWDQGVITVVSDGAGRQAGVQPGWKFSTINGARYSEKLLDEKLAGGAEFQATFLVNVREPEYKEVTLEFKTGTIGVGCEDWDIGYVTDCQPDTQAGEKGVQLGWKIDKLEGDAYVGEELDKKVASGEDYELTFLVPVDIVLEQEKPEVISEISIKKFKEETFWTVVNGKGVVVRKDMDNTNRTSPKVDTLDFGALLTADELAGNRLHIIEPVEGWVSLKNKKGYVLVQKNEIPGGEEIPETEE